MLPPKKELLKSVKTLQLPENCSFKTVKENYKDLILKWHPDKCRKNKEKCEKMTRKITQAYKTINDFFENHTFNFSDEEIDKQYKYEPAELFNKLFGEGDSHWGV